MNKILTKIVGAALGLSMAVGVGTAVAMNSKDAVRANAADELFYTLTPASGANNSYAGNCDIAISGITWNLTGNSQMQPWRIGGNKITSTDRTLYSKTAMGSAITKIELATGTSSITVNSLKLIVASDANFSNQIDVVTETFSASSTITFSPTSPATNWATGAYYKFVFNVTNSSKDNKYLQFVNAKFYRDSSAGSKYTVTYDVKGGTGSVTDSNEYDKNDTVTVLGIGSVTKTGYTFINWKDADSSTTYVAGNTFSITANTVLEAQWYHDDSISVVSGKESNVIYTDGTLNLSTCVTAVGDGALSFTVPSVNYLTYDSSTTTITADSTNTGGPLTITAYKGEQSCTFTVTVETRPSTGTFNLFDGSVEEGEYVICVSTDALKNSITSQRGDYSSVTVVNNSIQSPDSAVIWQFIASGNYFKLYNADVDKYFSSTGAANKAGLSDGSDDKALWTIAESSTGVYHFTNKYNSDNSVNAKLQKNGTYGFACYAGFSDITLYKKTGAIVPADSVSVEAHDGTSSMSLAKESIGNISDILRSTVYGDDGETLATNQKVTWSCEDSAGVITFDNSAKTYRVVGAINATTKIYATSDDGSIKSSNYVSLTVSQPSMPYTLVPGTNGYSNSEETTEVVWTDASIYLDVYYLGVHFNMDGNGGSNSGKYNSNSSTWRMYQSEGTVFTVTVPLGQKITSITFEYNVDHTGILIDSSDAQVASNSEWTPASGTEVRIASFGVGQTGSATNGQVQFKSIAVSFAASTQPAVYINELTSELSKSDTGTFTAETTHATGCTFSWSSSPSSVIRIDNASTGSFTAVGEGTATVSVTMTCNEGSASDTMDVVVNTGLISIADANTICSGLADGATTAYKVTISGYVTSLNADNHNPARAFLVSDFEVGGTGNSLEVYGIYDSSSNLREYVVLNGTISFKGHLTKFVSGGNTVYELTSPELVSYTDDAVEFASTAYESLSATCEAYGPQGISESTWNALASTWTNDVDSYSKAKMQAATSSYEYSEAIANWIERYTIIVQSGKTDFMQMGISSNARSSLTSLVGDSSSVVSIIVVISVISLTTIGAFVFVRRRKEN